MQIPIIGNPSSSTPRKLAFGMVHLREVSLDTHSNQSRWRIEDAFAPGGEGDRLVKTFASNLLTRHLQGQPATFSTHKLNEALGGRHQQWKVGTSLGQKALEILMSKGILSLYAGQYTVNLELLQKLKSSTAPAPGVIEGEEETDGAPQVSAETPAEATPAKRKRGRKSGVAYATRTDKGQKKPAGKGVKAKTAPPTTSDVSALRATAAAMLKGPLADVMAKFMPKD